MASGVCCLEDRVLTRSEYLGLRMLRLRRMSRLWREQRMFERGERQVRVGVD
jgi:hypothetical protein